MKWEELGDGKCRWCQSMVGVNHNRFCRSCYEFSEDVVRRIDQVWFYVIGYVNGATRGGAVDGAELVASCKAATMKEFGMREWGGRSD